MIPFRMEMSLSTPPERLWAILTDVPAISGCIPGCEEVEEEAPLATYRARMRQKIGPFRVDIPAEITVTEVRVARRIATRATGRDRLTGTRMAVTLDVDLAAQGVGTALAVAAELEVQGRLASLGQALIRRRAEENFAEFDRRLRALLEERQDDASPTV